MAKNKARVPMPISERAKQFLPFDAMRGLRELLAKKELPRVPQKELSEEAGEELNRTLSALMEGDTVTVVYYDEKEETECQLTGMVREKNVTERRLTVGATVLSFDALYEIVCHKNAE